MNILIVDDSLLIRMQLKSFLEQTLEHEVVAQGADGNEAVQLYKKHSPDLTILDLTMPNKDGQQALSEIISHDENARIVICSAIKDSDKINETLLEGARGYILKPLRLNSEDYIDSFRDTLAEAMED